MQTKNCQNKIIKLSIVVPVYKVEQYIEKCIASILTSKYFDSDCELIVVDDGSPDKSIEIVNRICCTRSNVTIYRQQNRGLGSARNTGEKLARGNYLWFIDSDDWITEDAIERILLAIFDHEPDIINIDYVMSDGNRTTVVNNSTPCVLYRGIQYLQDSCVQSPVQYYIFRSDFYRKHNLRFEENLYHEDALFTPIALFFAQRVVRVGTYCYVYNIREGSIMTSGNNLKHARDMVRISVELENFTTRTARSLHDRFVLSRYTSHAVGGIYYYWKLLNRKERHTLAPELKLRSFLRPIVRSGSLKCLFALIAMWVK